tara:strand:- start:1890 stop:2354 length:465 start_codon:yes stop_codon:yes gene_type:complete
MINLLISDFDGVFTDNSVFISENGIESVRCNRSDGIGISLLKESGVEFIVCSSEKVNIAKYRANKIGFESFVDVKNKGYFIRNYLSKKSFNPSNVAYIGNDINDLSAFDSVGYKIAVKDAYPEIILKADKILNRKGGYGAVREACEHILKINNN